jgi:hypothetical protein
MSDTLSSTIFDPSDLWPGEQALLQKVAIGEWDVCPIKAAEARTEIRAAFIRHLLLQLPVPDENGKPWPIQSSGIQLCNASVVGLLNLKDGRNPQGGALPNLELENCLFDHLVWLDFAHFQRLSLKGSVLPRLSAKRVRIETDLNLFSVEVLSTDSADVQKAAVNLRGCHVEGRLTLDLASINTKRVPDKTSATIKRGGCSHAISLNESTVCGTLSAERLWSYGLISLHNAHFRGAAWFSASRFDGIEEGNSDGNEVLIDAMCAHFGGLVSFQGASVLQADGTEAFVPCAVAGCLKLLAATIDGALLLNHCVVRDGLTGRDVTLRGGLEAIDATFGTEVSFLNAHLYGDVTFKRCTLLPAPTSGTGDEQVERYTSSLDFDGATIDGKLVLEFEVSPAARIFLNSASSASDLRISVSRKNVDETVEEGPLEIYANDINVSGNCTLTVPSYAKVFAWCATVAIDLLVASDQAVGVEWNFNGATVGNLDTFNGLGWGVRPSIRAIDLTYSNLRITPGQMNIGWLRNLLPRQAPQPYLQLSKVLSASGYEELARTVVTRKNWAAIRYALVDPFKGRPIVLYPLVAFGFLLTAPFKILIPTLFGWFFRFGLSPFRAAVTLCILIGLGWLGADYALKNRMMVLSTQPVASQYVSGGALPEMVVPMANTQGRTSMPCGDNISPLWYAVDLFVPLIDLKQASQCTPQIEGTHSFEIIGNWHVPVTTAGLRWITSIYALIGAIVTSLTVLTFSGVLNGTLKE